MKLLPETVERLPMGADAVLLAAHCKIEITSSSSREVHDHSIDMNHGCAAHRHSPARKGGTVCDS
jgi:hypothetical protein